MPVSFVCPLCRRERPNGEKSWNLRKRRSTLRCTNPACDGRYTQVPFPIVHVSPGRSFERMVHIPEGVPLTALGMMLRTLPEKSPLLDMLRRRSTHVWTHFHDLLPESYRPDFIHPAPFPLRALEMLDEAEIKPGAKALVVGAGPGREALEVALRLRRISEAQTANPGFEDTTIQHFYPEVYALDLDPCNLDLFQKISRGPAEVILRASTDVWHSPEELSLPRALRAVSDLVHPVCGDALSPPFAAESFDLIVSLNLLDKVSEPLSMLAQMQRLLKPGGHLLLSSAFAWNHQRTPQDARFAAAIPHARRPDTELLQDILSGRLQVGVRFDLHTVAVRPSMPWPVRIHDTLFHMHMTHVSLWKRPKA